MTGSPESDVPSNIPSNESIDRSSAAASLEEKAGHIRSSKVSLWSSLFTSPFSIIESHPESSSGEKKSSSGEKKVNKSTSYWTTTVKKVMAIGSMRRFQERFLGTSTSDMSSSTSDIWFLGSCYKARQEDASNGGNGLVEFLQDFSSRIWVTYRKGFDAIDEKSKLTSDANWGCMIRSSQMLVAQALLFHHLGRSWRKSMQKPYDPEYIEILHLFGDSESCTFSIHNLLQAGRDYGLAAGSWLGPYAMCRAWETLARTNKEPADCVKRNGTLPMAVYIVSGDEAGQRGGAPAVCIDTAARLSSDFSMGMQTWAPLLLLVPLVLGLEKINPRYIPLLLKTFTFPQSLGILGGKPGASTYIAGVQDDKALYLDPHVVQPVVHIRSGDLEADTSSYHCSTIRHLQLDLIDPSLAIGFYCRDEEDFKDFCLRASKLEDLSNGAPLFTVTQSLRLANTSLHDVVAGSSHDINDNGEGRTFDLDNFNDNDAIVDEDDWQIL